LQQKNTGKYRRVFAPASAPQAFCLKIRRFSANFAGGLPAGFAA
jgi:hypothetical protein